MVALDATRWIVSDGTGLLYLIDVKQGPDGALSGNLASSYEVNESLFDSVPADGQPSLPFRLHSAHITESGDILVLVSTKAPNTSPGPTLPQTRLKPTQAQFLLSALVLHSLDAVQRTNRLWSLRSDDLPSYVSYDAKSQEFTILAESQYIGRDDSRILPPADPRPDEIAPIPRTGENLDIVGDTADSKPGIKPPPPYSWTQSSDSLTIVFFLPSSTPKSAIHVNLAARSLTVLVDDPPSSSATSHPIPIPKYALKKFWDGIDSSASFWTWEKDGDSISSSNDSGRTHTVGVLTLHLEKQHDGTKWPHIFASAEGGHDDDVPETLDPSELYAIRESLEKYTAALADGSDASGLGLGSGLPSLAQGEIDDEVDAKVGVPAVLTFVNARDGQYRGNGWPFDVLSFPLPTITDSPGALIIRNDIDGLVYTPDDNHGWEHTSTFPALSFVLASKRDTRFVFHHASDTVLAFESGGSASGLGGNMYVYRNAHGKKWAQQAVLKIGGGGAGTLLGVVGIKDADGGVRVVCLCDKEILVLKGVV